MKKYALLLFIILITNPYAHAFGFKDIISPESSVKHLINSQIKYANNGNFEKFISTYDKNYVNADGFDLDVYSKLVKDIWGSYENIKYSIKFNEIKVNKDIATVKVQESSNADLALTKNYKGKLNSTSDSIYHLKKIDGKWKVCADEILGETTTMLYGDAQNLDIKLTVPENIPANTDYIAALEFEVPEDSVAIASLAADKVEYPQKQPKEVFRAMPEDNILERFFTSNNDNVNEYIIASIGLTKTNICDLSIKLSLSGFGYVIKRVNVLPPVMSDN